MNDTPLSLLERLREPDQQASWKQFVALYDPLIRRWLSQERLGVADIDDLVQDVISVVLREIGQFDHGGRPGSFRRWLRMILVHRTRDYWKRQRRDRLAAFDETNGPTVLDRLEDPDSDLSRTWDAEHDELVARRLLDLVAPNFAPRTWEAFRLLMIEQRTPGEVAASLGLSVNAVLIAKSRVLRRLREEGRGLIEPADD